VEEFCVDLVFGLGEGFLVFTEPCFDDGVFSFGLLVLFGPEEALYCKLRRFMKSSGN